MNVFKNLTNPKVVDEIDVYTFLDNIKNPDTEVLQKITKARSIYSFDKEKYKNIKTSLPCFTLNFDFIEKKSNDNIKAPTGFIYIDVDDTTDIDFSNPLIFASWKSLSNTGRGILVKVSGLGLDNFKSTYRELAKKLNLKADIHAGKATQYCIHSYDKDLYLNNDSITWEAKNVELIKPPLRGYPYKKDSKNMGEKKQIRFSTIDEYDFQNEDYLYFEEEKELVSQVIVPRKIMEGGRNNILYGIAYQIKALNPDISYENLSRLIYYINLKKCFPILGRYEVDTILKKVDEMEQIIPETNRERRFLFNPERSLTFKEKMKIINPKLGKQRTNRTIEKLGMHIDQWDVSTQGKITQEKLQEVSGFNIKTIEKYYKLFKEQINELKEKYKLSKLTNLKVVS